MKPELLAAGVAAMLAAGIVSPAAAQDTPQDWLRHCQEQGDHDRRQCEVREYHFAAGKSLRVDANPNGGIQVRAWDKAEVRVVAKVETRGHSLADAQDLAASVKVEAGPGEVRSTGPQSLGGRRNWSVSYDVWVPAATDLRLRSTNGGLGVEGGSGVLDLETTNGGIDLTEVLGQVRAETTNGGITIELGGTTWKGSGIEAEAVNGSIRLTVPEGLSADLEVETTNGGIDVDFPVQVQGRIGRHLKTRLGQGGPLVHLETTNGGVSIRRK